MGEEREERREIEERRGHAQVTFHLQPSAAFWKRCLENVTETTFFEAQFEKPQHRTVPQNCFHNREVHEVDQARLAVQSDELSELLLCHPMHEHSDYDTKMESLTEQSWRIIRYVSTVRYAF